MIMERPDPLERSRVNALRDLRNIQSNIITGLQKSCFKDLNVVLCSDPGHLPWRSERGFADGRPTKERFFRCGPLRDFIANHHIQMPGTRE